MADLRKLSPADREVLLLLAEGHTAKSAASRLGVSVNTINERLRSARSKSGVGSSRELARLVREACGDAQESRHKEIGIGQQAEADAWRPPTSILTVRIALTKGALAMTVAAIGVATAAVYILSGVFAPAALSAQAPHVVGTFPAANAEVEPGRIILRVTFDRPMRPGSYSFVSRSLETFPRCSFPPVQSSDGRSFSLDCTVDAHHAYQVDFNSARFQNFVAAKDAVAAVPSFLRFSTR
jgi:DNA-binding CsgD family transcriptional regulator